MEAPFPASTGAHTEDDATTGGDKMAGRAQEDEMMYFTPIGAGSEVGRSCHILKFKGRTIMMDCGAHPAYNGLGALPFFDEIDPEEVDFVLITHFHIDHCASLPYLMEKTNFRGRVFMTHPTKAIFKWMLSDYVRVSANSADDMPYDEQDLQNAYDRIEAIDFHQVVEVEGVRFTAYNAGHVLGASMFLIEVAGVRVLYTGDYSREEDRHLMRAEEPRDNVDVLVCESTYGVQNHTPRSEREARFTSLVHNIVARGGRCLVPIFALGRAQELLLILDEYWQEHPELQHVPIYYASNLARKCMAVYQTYVNMMNSHIRRQFAQKNPFMFKYISYLKSMAIFDDVGPCVMMAAPAMLQSGLSRELLELWCPEKKNGLIIPGYVVEGTLGKHILSEPSEITSSSGSKLPVRCSIDYISFSAHVDYAQNREFIELVNPSHLILVHGETNMMTRLRNALHSVWSDRDPDSAHGAPPRIHAPKNAEKVSLHFKGEKYAKALGDLASAVANCAVEATVIHPNGADGDDSDAEDGAVSKVVPTAGSIIQGLVVAKDFHYHLVSASELGEFTDLVPAVIHQRQYVPLETVTWDLVVWHLELVYPEMIKPVHSDDKNDDKPTTPSSDPGSTAGSASASEKKATLAVEVCGAIKVSLAANSRELVVDWAGNPVNDFLADSVLAVLLNVESSPAAVKMTTGSPSKHKCDRGSVDHDSHEHKENTVKQDELKQEGGELLPKEAEPRVLDEAETKAFVEIERIHDQEADLETWDDLVSYVKGELIEFLSLSYDEVEEEADHVIVVRLDGKECRIGVASLTIDCADEGFRQRIASIVERVGMVSSMTWLERWVDKSAMPIPR